MDPKSVKQETSRQWSEGLTAAARTTQLIRGGSPESLSRSPVSPSAEPLAAPPPRSEMASIGAGARGTGRSREKQPADESRRLPRDSNAESDDIVVAGENAEPSSAERDAEHFKMVATRFRALMERRERRLEEAMSDPQTRSDLEAMFPGMKQGDYQTLLAGVRGMEEDDFQALLAGARKRRQERDYGKQGMEDRKLGVLGPPAPHRSQTPPAYVRPPENFNGTGGGGYAQSDLPYPPPPESFEQYPPPFYSRDTKNFEHKERRTEPPPYELYERYGWGRHAPLPPPSTAGRRHAESDGKIFGTHRRPPSPSRSYVDEGPSFNDHNQEWRRQQHGWHHQQQLDPHWTNSRRVRDLDQHNSLRAGYEDRRDLDRYPDSNRGEKQRFSNGRHTGDGDSEPRYHRPQSERTIDQPFSPRKPESSNRSVESPVNPAEHEDHFKDHGATQLLRGDNRHIPNAEHPTIDPSLCDAVERVCESRERNGSIRKKSPGRGKPDITPVAAHSVHGQTGGGNEISTSVKRDGGVDTEGRRGPERYVDPPGGSVVVADVIDAKPSNQQEAQDILAATRRINRYDEGISDMIRNPKRPPMHDIPGDLTDAQYNELIAPHTQHRSHGYRDPRHGHHDADYSFKRENERIYPQGRERAYREHESERYPPSEDVGYPPDTRTPYHRGTGYYRPEEIGRGGRSAFLTETVDERVFSDARRPIAGGGYRNPRDIYGPPNPRNPYAERRQENSRYVIGEEQPDHPMRRHRSNDVEDEDMKTPPVRDCPDMHGVHPPDIKRPRHEDGPRPGDRGRDYEHDRDRVAPRTHRPPSSARLSPSPQSRYHQQHQFHPQRHLNHERACHQAVRKTLTAAPESTSSLKAAIAAGPTVGGGGQVIRHNGAAGGGGAVVEGSPGTGPLRIGAPNGNVPSRADECHAGDKRQPESTNPDPRDGDGQGRDTGGGGGGGGDGSTGANGNGGNGDGGGCGEEDSARSRSKSPQLKDGSRVKPGSEGDEHAGVEAVKAFSEEVKDKSGFTRLFIPENPPIVPRRPPSKGNKRETLADIAQRIPVDVMRPYFNYPLRTAAEAMNISVTTLKRLCRRHGVKRWPHRQISGINRAMAHLEFQQEQAGRHGDRSGRRSDPQASHQMQELLRRRRVMIEHAFESDDGGRCRAPDSEDDGMDVDSFFSVNRSQHEPCDGHNHAQSHTSGSGNEGPEGGPHKHEIELEHRVDGPGSVMDMEHEREDGREGKSSRSRVAAAVELCNSGPSSSAGPGTMEAGDHLGSSMGHHRPTDNRRSRSRSQSRSRSRSRSRSPQRKNIRRLDTTKPQEPSDMRSAPLRSVLPLPQPPRISIPQPPSTVRPSSRGSASPSPKNFAQQRPKPPQAPRSPLTCGPMMSNWREPVKELSLVNEQQKQQQQPQKHEHEHRHRSHSRRAPSQSKSPSPTSTSVSSANLPGFSLSSAMAQSEPWQPSPVSKSSGQAPS